MKNIFKLFGLIALVATMIFMVVGCEEPGDPAPNNPGPSKPGPSKPGGPVAVKSVSISGGNSVLIGGSLQLTVVFDPADATNKNVSWSSSDETKATVSADGLVTGLAKGQVTVTVTTQDGNKTAAHDIAVTDIPVAVTGVSLDETDLVLFVDGVAWLTATIAPYNATNSNVTWLSSNTSVATVSGNGLTVTINPIAVGTTTITVTTDDGSLSAMCAVYVQILTLNGEISIEGSAMSILNKPLYANYSGDEDVTYQWYKDGVEIPSATEHTYTPITDGIYTVTVSAPGCQSKTSTAVLITSALYIITGDSSAGFTATRDDVVIDGAENESIQTVISAIRVDVNGGSCIIQFGEFGEVAEEIDIGAESVEFNNTGGSWGIISLAGIVTSANENASQGTIAVNGAISINSTADIANTADNANARAVYFNSTGAMNILSGTVSADTGVAVYSASTGTITVSGTANLTSANETETAGTIYLTNSGTGTDIRLVITDGVVRNTSAASTNSRAVYNAGTGGITISGGTVSAIGSNGIAVYSNSTGIITVTGIANITSDTYGDDKGTIYLADSGTSTNVRLTIKGGTVRSTGSYLTAIYNAGTGGITISGGTVSGRVYNANNGGIMISGGKLEAIGVNGVSGNTVYNNGTGSITISGGTVGRIENRSTGNITISGGTVGSIDNSSTGDITISGGTVSGGTNVAVYNGSTGLITVSGDAVVTSDNLSQDYKYGRGGTIFLANNGSDTDVRLAITGGTVHNRGNWAVCNSSSGEVTISGGKVSSVLMAGDDEIDYTAVFNAKNGRLTISGGTVSGRVNSYGGPITVSDNALITSDTNGATIMFENGGFDDVEWYEPVLEITGGTVSNTGSGRAVYNELDDGGNITISGGTVSANAGIAVVGGNSLITISGNAVVTSANVATYIISGYLPIYNHYEGGTIYLRYREAGNLAITGGTVRNTSNNVNAWVVCNNGTGAVTISGGTIEAATAANIAVRNQSTGRINLYGNPSIRGIISRADAAAVLNVSGSNPAFAPLPSIKKYMLDFDTYTNGITAVTGGGPFSNNFGLVNTAAWLTASGSDLIANIPTLTGITASYNAVGTTVYTSTPLDNLKNNLTVTANYNTGVNTTLNAANYTLSVTSGGSLTTAGAKTITVTCEGTTTTFNITVVAVALDSITANYTGTAAIYPSTSQNDLNKLKDNLAVVAQYNDGTTTGLASSAYSLSVGGGSTLTVGSNTVTVTYSGQTKTFTVTVTAVALTGIEASYTGTAPIYAITPLDSLKANFTVTAQYNNGTTKTVASTSTPTYTLSGTLTVGTSTITVSYTDGGVTKTTTFTVTVSPPISVTFSGVTANGNTTTTTTQLTLTFSQVIAGLTADDITLSGVEGVSKGTLSSSGTTYTLGISGFTSGGTLFVKVAKANYNISGDQKNATIYYMIPVTFSDVSANGNTTTTTTTQLTLTFSQAITGLTANDITLSGVSGVVKGTLSGSGPTYILGISGFTSGGTLTVAVAKDGYTINDSPKDTTIYAPPQPYNYIITGSGSSFTAVRNNTTNIGTGTIAEIIPLIRANANGANCTIQFGSDGSTLDIGTASVELKEAWGTVTLAGNITSANANAASGQGTISTANAVSINLQDSTVIVNTGISGTAIYHNSTGTATIKGTVSKTGSFGYAVWNHSTGRVTISGGTVSAGNGYAVGTGSISGTITINSGTISSESSYAVYKNGTATITINGGTITSGSNSAVYNAGNGGSVTISGGTISSSATSSDRGTVQHSGNGSLTISGGRVEKTGNGPAVYSTSNSNSGSITISSNALITSASTAINLYSGSAPLNITGGTVEATGASGNALYNNGTGSITISGGTVKNTNSSNAGHAVHNNNASALTISSGTVSTVGTSASSAVYNQNNNGTVTISGGTVSSASGPTIYNGGNGAITISGGEVKNTSVQNTSVDSATTRAVYNRYTGQINLYGNPLITGWIFRYESAAILNVAGGNPAFAPSTGRKYKISYQTIPANLVVAVTGGGIGGTPADGLKAYFELPAPASQYQTLSLAKRDNDLVISRNM